MSIVNFDVSLTPEEAIRLISQSIVEGSFTGELIDSYTSTTRDGLRCITAVYEKHFYRAGNRLTLSVFVDNLQGQTHVHAVGGGGGEGFLSFDWGASDSFADEVQGALSSYLI